MGLSATRSSQYYQGNPDSGHASPRKRFRRDSSDTQDQESLCHTSQDTQHIASYTSLPSEHGSIISFPLDATNTPSLTTSIDPKSTVPSSSASLTSVTTLAVGSLRLSLAKLKDQAHANRLLIQQQLVEGKGTEEAYTRYVKNYLSFWSSFQDQKIKEDPQWIRIPAHPIIGDKVAIFLQHETTRNKRDHHGNEINGTSVGKNSIAQCISAIQSYVNEHQHDPEYQNCPEIHIPLRNQPCVKTFEKAACANEPTRISKALIAKSKGTISDTYTKEELIRSRFGA